MSAKSKSAASVRWPWLLAATSIVVIAAALAEEFSITTYYPSPRGVYKELRTTGATYLATTSGSVGIGTNNPGQYKLSVNGDVTLNNKKLANVADPTGTNDAATMGWVLAQLGGGSVKTTTVNAPPIGWSQEASYWNTSATAAPCSSLGSGWEEVGLCLSYDGSKWAPNNCTASTYVSEGGIRSTGTTWRFCTR